MEEGVIRNRSRGLCWPDLAWSPPALSLSLLTSPSHAFLQPIPLPLLSSPSLFTHGPQQPRKTHEWKVKQTKGDR